MADRINVMRRCGLAIGTLVMMLILSSSCAEADRRAANSAAPKFEQYAADAIYKVFPFDRESFYLADSNDSKRGFTFFDPTSDGHEIVKCSQAAHFRIVRHANAVADVGIGECGKERSRIEELARNAPTKLKQALGSLSRSAPNASQEQLRRMGVSYEKRLLADGSEQHYFPVLIISHGAIFVPTIVVIKKETAWVVQANTATLCLQDESHRLCTDVMQSLSQIATNLSASEKR